MSCVRANPATSLSASEGQSCVTNATKQTMPRFQLGMQRGGQHPNLDASHVGKTSRMLDEVEALPRRQTGAAGRSQGRKDDD